jgi:glycosyltransferase involved in cell wall biosynthesis
MIIGPEEDKPYAKCLKTMVSTQNLNHLFLFPGFRKDIPEILSETDIFVMSSKNEGLPTTCLEAMAAGRAVVATRCGGPEEIILDGETGILVNVNNPQMMAEAILCLLKNHQLRLEMGAKGRLRVQTEFSCSQFINNIESCIFAFTHNMHSEQGCIPLYLQCIHLIK